MISMTLLLSGVAVPAYARYLGKIDISAVDMDPPMAAGQHFAEVRPLLCEPVAGILVSAALQSDAPPVLDADDVEVANPTYRRVTQVQVIVENTTASPITFTDALVRLSGELAAPLPAGYSYQAPASFSPATSIFSVKDRDGAAVTSAAFTAQLSSVAHATDADTVGSQTPAQLRARSSHTGTQAASTISDFTEAAQDAIAAALTNSTSVLFTYDDAGNHITEAVKPDNAGIEIDATNGLQLKNTAVTPGTYGDDTHVAQITVDAKGRLTAATEVEITGGGGGDSQEDILGSILTDEDGNVLVDEDGIVMFTPI